jgi:hypothetical protein
MNVSSIQASESSVRRNLFIKYANSFMSNPDENTASPVDKASEANPELSRLNKSMGIETLTIFPKQIVDGKMVITA